MDFFETYHKLKQRIKDAGVKQVDRKRNHRQRQSDVAKGLPVDPTPYSAQHDPDVGRVKLTIMHNLYNELRGVEYRHKENHQHYFLFYSLRKAIEAEFPIVPFPERRELTT